MASTSLPLATAAAVATFFASPAGAVPNEQPTTPGTPGPAQPGTTDTQNSPETTEPGVQQPGVQGQDDPATPPTPSQPGVTTPKPNQPGQEQDNLTAPTQPGVTTPRVAPLPVPGQPNPVQPVIEQDRQPGEQDPNRPEAENEPGAEGADAPDAENSDGAAPSEDNAQTTDPEMETLVQPQQWQAPRNEAAPPAPVVEMTGPHAEIGAAIDGGTLIPGHVANTHHFRNDAGYVGTVGYATPEGAGEAGISVEFLDVNTIKVSTFTGGQGLPDNKATHMIDTTQLNAAKAAVEHWIAAQPGGAAALEAAANFQPPALLPPGDIAPQTINVAGVTTQWGGSLQY